MLSVSVRGETVRVPAVLTDNVSSVIGATVKTDTTPGSVAMPTSSVKPRLFVDNDVMTYSTSVNITSLQHFTEYVVKVCVCCHFVCPIGAVTDLSMDPC